MTNEEMKKALKKGGVAASDIEKISGKYDAEKITEIVEGSNNPKEAFEAIHDFYPELEVEKLQEQMDFIQEQLEAASKVQREKETVELTEEELSNVSGGGWFSDVGGWFKKNWKKVAISAAVVVAGVALGVAAGVAAGVVFAAGAAAAVAAGTLTAASTVAPAYVASIGIGTVVGFSFVPVICEKVKG